MLAKSNFLATNGHASM